MRKILLSVLVGLSATVALAELAAIKDGLVYNLDASDVTTITTNELGNVVEWRAKEGMADMVFKGGTLEETDSRIHPKIVPAAHAHSTKFCYNYPCGLLSGSFCARRIIRH